MTVSEEFKLAIKTGNFREACLLLVSQALSLKVTTSINQISQSKLQTSIDVMGGEINNQVDHDFLTYSHHSLAEKMHFAQVNAAPELIMQYIKTWHYLSEFFSDPENISINIPKTEVASLPPEQSTTEGQWSEFLDEVQTIEVITQENSDEEDWGDWMEEEDGEKKDNDQE